MAINSRQLQALQQLIQRQQAQDDGLLTFRAGRMTMDDSRTVTAKNERGKIKFYKSDEGLLHLEWINRISNKSDMDIMIFPDSAKWVKVPECTDGRVYVLKFNGSSRREFFWMQEPENDKDNEITEKINKLISGDSGAAGGGGAAAAAGAGLGLGGLGFDGLFGNNANRGASGTGGTSGTSGNSGASGGGDDLTRLFMNALTQQMTGAFGGTGQQGTTGGSGNSGTTGGNNPAAAAGNPLMQAMIEQQLAQREELKKEPDLSDILDPSQSEISSVLDDEKVIEQLSQHLPEEMRDGKSILEQLSSPQFLGSLRRLNHIINSPQMTILLQQMGIAPVGEKIGVKAFIEAIIKAKQNNNNNNGNSGSSSS